MSIVHVCWPPSVQSPNQTTTSARSTATVAAVQLIASRSPSSHPHLDCQSVVHSELGGSWLSMVARVFCQYSSRPPIDTTPRGLAVGCPEDGCRHTNPTASPSSAANTPTPHHRPQSKSGGRMVLIKRERLPDTFLLLFFPVFRDVTCWQCANPWSTDNNLLKLSADRLA